MQATDAFHFPRGFLWGTATSSHQVEGQQANNDWWAAEEQGGMIYKNQRSGPACDWWNRAEEDFDRMADLGHRTHRLSIEWSSIQPKPDRWDLGALDRYVEMISGLRERDIEPMVTLHHFTNPIWVAERGGWANENIIPLFQKYVERVVRRLSDQVTLWCTINEPMVLVSQGMMLGLWPPGKRDFSMARRAAINLARAHAVAYHTIHDIDDRAQVGLAKHMVVWNPDHIWLPTDHLVARLFNFISNHIFLRAITQGVVRLPGTRPIRIDRARGTLEWLGVNYYQRYRVGLRMRQMLQSLIPGLSGEFLYRGTRPDHPQGPGTWGEFHPRGLYESLGSLMRYGVPLYVTENGIPSQDDGPRVRFLINHLHQLWNAIQDGFPVQGYYHWSLLDNFEWAEGYNPLYRFGLIEVDFETQQRRVRESGQTYGQIAQANAITRDTVGRFAPDLDSHLFGGNHRS
ncbi:MAG: glycoside hydrolase family 1 protein [Chloroflexi bacterium]|nr:glycoside hydrolase family 1 protein [Chloroflexota bacterium]